MLFTCLLFLWKAQTTFFKKLLITPVRSNYSPKWFQSFTIITNPNISRYGIKNITQQSHRITRNNLNKNIELPRIFVCIYKNILNTKNICLYLNSVYFGNVKKFLDVNYSTVLDFQYWQEVKRKITHSKSFLFLI